MVKMLCMLYRIIPRFLNASIDNKFLSVSITLDHMRETMTVSRYQVVNTEENWER